MSAGVKHCLILMGLVLLTACQQLVTGNLGTTSDDPGDDNPPSVPIPVESSAALRLGDRYFIESVFRNSFGSSAQVTTAISSLVQSQFVDFGSGCDKFGPTGDNCNGAYQNSLLNPITPVTSMREAFRLRACYFILSRKTGFGEEDRPLREGVAKAKGVDVSLVNLDGLTMPTALEVRNAYQLFFPELEPSSELVSKLLAVAQANQGYGAREPWRFLFLTLCSSPAWQAP